MPASPAGYSINPVPPNSTANLPPTPLPTPAPARCDTRGKSRPIEHSALRDFELTYVGLGSAADITRLLSNVRFASKRWGNRPTSLWIAEEFGCCASG